MGAASDRVSSGLKSLGALAPTPSVSPIEGTVVDGEGAGSLDGRACISSSSLELEELALTLLSSTSIDSCISVYELAAGATSGWTALDTAGFCSTGEANPFRMINCSICRKKEVSSWSTSKSKTRTSF